MEIINKLPEVNFNLALVVCSSLLMVFGIILMVLSIRNLTRTKKTVKLAEAWSENGTAISDWLRTHLLELNLNQEAAISNPEFQELLWRDFEIYNKLVILDPKLKEDPIVQEGRSFYGLLIRTEGQKPS